MPYGFLFHSENVVGVMECDPIHRRMTGVRAVEVSVASAVVGFGDMALVGSRNRAVAFDPELGVMPTSIDGGFRAGIRTDDLLILAREGTITCLDSNWPELGRVSSAQRRTRTTSSYLMGVSMPWPAPAGGRDKPFGLRLHLRSAILPAGLLVGSINGGEVSPATLGSTYWVGRGSLLWRTRFLCGGTPIEFSEGLRFPVFLVGQRGTPTTPQNGLVG